jgi:hypothetical protein
MLLTTNKEAAVTAAFLSGGISEMSSSLFHWNLIKPRVASTALGRNSRPPVPEGSG